MTTVESSRDKTKHAEETRVLRDLGALFAEFTVYPRLDTAVKLGRAIDIYVNVLNNWCEPTGLQCHKARIL